MDKNAITILEHIIQARIDNAENSDSRIAWTSMQSLLAYALAGDLDALSNYDYLPTNEDKTADLFITECDDGFVAEVNSDDGFAAMMKILFG